MSAAECRCYTMASTTSPPVGCVFGQHCRTKIVWQDKINSAPPFRRPALVGAGEPVPQMHADVPLRAGERPGLSAFQVAFMNARHNSGLELGRNNTVHRNNVTRVCHALRPFIFALCAGGAGGAGAGAGVGAGAGGECSPPACTRGPRLGRRPERSPRGYGRGRGSRGVSWLRPLSLLQPITQKLLTLVFTIVVRFDSS
eukprot:SAG22_NODE_434_length_10555_cov_3.917559_1_plen_199_part_00